MYITVQAAEAEVEPAAQEHSSEMTVCGCHTVAHWVLPKLSALVGTLWSKSQPQSHIVQQSVYKSVILRTSRECFVYQLNVHIMI